MRNPKVQILYTLIDHPLYPGEKIRAYLAEDCGPPKTELANLHKQWRRSKNPAIVIQAFLFAHRRQVTVPRWVLDCVADVFQKFRDDHISGKGKASLDKLFGFTSARGKKLPPYKRLGREVRDGVMMSELYMLRTLGFTHEDAADMVAERHRGKTFGITRSHRVPGLSGETLANRYKKERWAADFKKSVYLGSWPRSEGDKTNFLSKFPTHSLPTKRRKRRSG